MTGVTGSLGAHVLARLAHVEDVKKVYCLIRATSEKEARIRMIRSLRERKIYQDLSLADRRKIVCLPSDLSLPSLGVEPRRYEEIASQITALYHCAWSVNFNLKLSSFEKDGIAGIKNLIDLCLGAHGKTPARFTFCSSVGTVLRTKEKIIPEALPFDFSCAQPTGYAQSKLVAEHICLNAVAKAGLPAYILRVGQIVGDTKHGVWNSTEATPLMMQTALTIGVLPTVDESMRWLPVDVVAQSTIEITNSDAKSGIFNLVNPYTFHWTRDLLPYLRRAGLKFNELDPPSWLNLLRASNSNPAENPPIKLLPYFTANYDTTEPRRVFDFQTDNMRRWSPTFDNTRAPDEELVSKMVRHFTTACWNSLQEIGARSSQKSSIVIYGPDATERAKLVSSLSSCLKLPVLEDREDMNDQAFQTIIIDAGSTLKKAEQDRLKGDPHRRMLFLDLQDGETNGVTFAVNDKSVDVVPLDAAMTDGELLEEAELWTRDFLRSP